MLHSIIQFAAAGCKPADTSFFFGLPKWYKYLDGTMVSSRTDGSGADFCAPRLTAMTDIWLVAAAVLEILLRVAAIGAIVVIIWGGVKYIISQGEPDRISSARSTILDGITGLVITLIATAVITFVAGRF
jgi:hypothetical protein